MYLARVSLLLALLFFLGRCPAWAGSAAASASIPINPHFFHYDSKAPLDAAVTPLPDQDGLRVSRVTFASPIVTSYPADNTVIAFFYQPPGPGPYPAMVVLHEWLPVNLVNEEQMCRAMAHAGVAAMLMEEPFSLQRRPVPHQAGAELLSGNLPETVAGLRQTVIDARRCADWLQSQPEIEPQKLGISGISLGGILAALVAGVDRRFSVVLLIDAGSDVADVIWNSVFTRGIHQGLVENGDTFDDLQTAMAPFEAGRWLSGFNPKDALLFNGRDDFFIRPREAKDMAKALNGAHIVWLNTGHYGPALSSREIESVGAKFLDSRFFPNQPPYQPPSDLPAQTIKLGLLLGGQEVASPALAYQAINFDPEGRFSLDAQLTLSGLSLALSANLNDTRSVGIEFPLLHSRSRPEPFIMFHIVL